MLSALTNTASSTMGVASPAQAQPDATSQLKGEAYPGAAECIAEIKARNLSQQMVTDVTGSWEALRYPLKLCRLCLFVASQVFFEGRADRQIGKLPSIGQNPALKLLL